MVFWQECTEVPADFDPLLPGPGRCLWRELSPLSGSCPCPPAPLVLRTERDHRYDKYLNSQECLFNPAASFLLKYRLAVQKLASVWSQHKNEVPEKDPVQRLLMRADLDTFPTPGLLGWWPTDLICNRNAATTHFR